MCCIFAPTVNTQYYYMNRKIMHKIVMMAVGEVVAALRPEAFESSQQVE